MGYACPVCGAPQPDGAHLANHLALTALLHDDEHAAWLAEVAPKWPERSPAVLAEAVVEDAEPIEVDTATGRRGHEPVPQTRHRDGPADPTVERVLDAAREMTRTASEADSEAEKD